VCCDTTHGQPPVQLPCNFRSSYQFNTTLRLCPQIAYNQLWISDLFMPYFHRNHVVHLCPWQSPCIVNVLRPLYFVMWQKLFTGIRVYEQSFVMECRTKTTLSDHNLHDITTFICRKNMFLICLVNNYVCTNMYVKVKNRAALWYVDIRGCSVKLLTSCVQITYGPDLSVSKHTCFTIEKSKDSLSHRIACGFTLPLWPERHHNGESIIAPTSLSHTFHMCRPVAIAR